MKTTKIGILHSLTGTMSMSEKPLVDAVLLAVDEINQAGGLLGYNIEPVIEDGASDPNVFAEKTEKLLNKKGITTIFGCWTSASRKAVKPLIESRNAQLWYPVQYEGLEESRNIVYTGSCLNQQIEPAITWILENKGKNIFLIGSDYVFPRTANMLVRALVERKGKVTNEEYIELGGNDFSSVIEKIGDTKPDIVFNTINGDSNISFYKKFHEAGVSAKDIPIMAVSVSEVEIQSITGYSHGHYACWSYFQSLDSTENLAFIKKFKTRYGIHRVVSDPVAMAYTQVYLWKQAAEDSLSIDSVEIRESLSGKSFTGPAGEVEIQSNNHVSKKAYIGEADRSGQFKIVWRSKAPIKPLPWLGIEDMNFPAKSLVTDVLNMFPQTIHSKGLLEKRVEEEVNKRRQKEQMLIQQSKIAAMGEMIGAIAHQWRQPLNALGIMLQDIKEAYDFGELDKKYIDKTVSESLNQILYMSRTIDDFRDFYRTSKDKETFSIIKAIKSVILLQEAQLRHNKIDVKINSDKTRSLAVTGYPNEFKQVVLNIISNARSAILEARQEEILSEDNGEILINITQEQETVTIHINNNGKTIPAEIMDRIFEPYFTTKKTGEGTGIGLYMSKTIIEKHMGGKLYAHNLEKGVSFTIELSEKNSP